MRVSVLLLLSAILITPAFGQRLGQSRQALIAESGAATQENHSKGTATYRHDSLKIEVTYKNDIAQRLVVTALDPLPEAAIIGILKLNAAGATWNELNVGGPTRIWQRSDFAQAKCDRSKPRTITLVDAPFRPAADQTLAPKRALSAQSQATAADGPVAGKPSAKGQPYPFALMVIIAAGLVFAVKFSRLKGKSSSGRKAARNVGNHSAPRAFGAQPSPPPDFDRSVSSGPPSLDTIGWENFELLVAEIFRRKGYRVEVGAGLGADGGKDVVLRKGDALELVQCKNLSRENRVTATQMRDFFGLVVADGARLGHFVTTGYFSADAKKFAAGKPIQLLERADVERQISEVSGPGENLCELSTWIDNFAAHARVIDPVCPFCESSMKLRRGATGRPFWGCVRYSSHRCRGKREGREPLLGERRVTC